MAHQVSVMTWISEEMISGRQVGPPQAKHHWERAEGDREETIRFGTNEVTDALDGTSVLQVLGAEASWVS